MLAAIAAVLINFIPPDLDSDGEPDSLRVPDHVSLTNRYGVRVESSQAGASIRILTPAGPGGAFGWDATWTGDADGDGASDICVTEPLSPTTEGLGRAFVYSSISGELLHVLHSTHTGQFGLAAQATDDVDGDGIEDTLVWSRTRDANGKFFNLPWIFSTATGCLLYPVDGEKAAIDRIRSDVDGDLAVSGEDVVAVASALGEGADGENEPLDVDSDAALTTDDVVLVINNLGTTLNAPPTLSFVGWSSLDPLTACLVNSADLPVPGDFVRAVPAPGRSIIWDPGVPLDPDGGDGGGGGSGGGGGGGGGDDDDHPGDPFDNGPPCSPEVDRVSRYICLRPEEPDGCTRVPLAATGGEGAGPAHWSVTGGVFETDSGAVSEIDAPSVSLRVCEPGVVTVFVGRPAYCSLPRQRIFRVVRVDVDIDSDNTDSFAEPERSLAEELIEATGPVDATPGKVIAVCDRDRDNDGVSDRIDGFDAILGAVIDDASTHASPVVVVDVQGPMEDNATLDIEYNTSDPNDLGEGEACLVPAAGILRMWTKGTALPRDPLPIEDGGDYVAPGNHSIAAFIQRFGPPPWRLYMEAVDAAVDGVSVSVDPDGVAPREPGDPQGGPEPFMCPDAVQVTASELRLWIKGCAGCQPFPIDAFVEAREPHPEDLDQPQGFFDRYNLFRVEVRDFRSFSASGVRVGTTTLPLELLGGYQSLTPWFYFAVEPQDNAPAGTWWLPLPGESVSTEYNPTDERLTTEKLLKQPHVKELDEVVGQAVGRARARFVPPTNGDSGVFGKLVHEEACTALQDARFNGRWKTNVWVDLQNNVVVSVNDVNFRPPVAQNGWVELDAVYMKRGRTIVQGQPLVPDDIIGSSFDLKTTAEMNERQIERQAAVMGGRKPIKVQVPYRQQPIQTQAGRTFAIVEDASAMRKIKALGMAAAGGFLLFNTCMVYADEQTDEDVAWQQLEISVQRYQQSHGDVALERLNLLDIIDWMRRWLAAATNDPNAAVIATEIFSRGIIDRLWR